MALAVIVGFAFQISGHGGAATRFIAPVGTVFLNLVKFIVCPLVLFSVMAGTVSMNNLKKVGILGLRTVLVFLATTLVAVSFALAVSHAVRSVFIAACYGIDQTLGQLGAIVATSTLASIGTADVPGAGVVMLTMVLSAAGLPLDGIALMAGIDRILDMGRTVLNITGDAAAAVVISCRGHRSHDAPGTNG